MPHPNIKTGDICLLHENLPKKNVASTYKYCRVVWATPDQDGLVKRAKLREVDICCLTFLPTVDNGQQGSSE